MSNFEGIFTVTYWTKQEIDYAYKWDTDNYAKMEVDRVQYTKKLQNHRVKKNDPNAEFSKSEMYCRKFMSYLILFLMVSLKTFSFQNIWCFVQNSSNNCFI
jgi:hypothetical protein